MFVFFSLIFVNAPVNAFCADCSFLHQWFCIPSIPVAVHIFLFTDSFFTFSKVMLNSLTWLTYSFNYLFYPRHVWRSFFSFPSASPKFDKLFHFLHLSFMCLLSIQISEESILFSLKHNTVSCFFLQFSSHFAKFIFLHLNLSN